MVRTAAHTALFALAAVVPTQGVVAQDPLSYTWGADDPGAIVVEFVDFGCSACAKFHAETYDALFREYVEAGKVRWTFVPFVSGQFVHSIEAAEAVSCAAREPGGLPAMRARVFETQREWSRSLHPRELFVEQARALGLDADAIDSCMRADETRPGIEAAGRRAQELGVRATPTFFLDGFPIPGALPLDFFREVLDKHLAGNGVGF